MFSIKEEVKLYFSLKAHPAVLYYHLNSKNKSLANNTQLKLRRKLHFQHGLTEDKSNLTKIHLDADLMLTICKKYAWMETIVATFPQNFEIWTMFTTNDVIFIFSWISSLLSNFPCIGVKLLENCQNYASTYGVR